MSVGTEEETANGSDSEDAAGVEVGTGAVVEAVGRSAAVNGTGASSVMGGSVVSAAAVLRGPALVLEAGGAVTDVTMGAREGDVDVGVEIVGLLGESP